MKERDKKEVKERKYQREREREREYQRERERERREGEGEKVSHLSQLSHTIEYTFVI